MLIVGHISSIADTRPCVLSFPFWDAFFAWVYTPNQSSLPKQGR